MWRAILGSVLPLLLAFAARAQLVGKIDAAFAVAPSGAATYQIPITVPPGTAGMQPELALAYDSQGPNGPLGVGFGLAGLSSIARCPSDLGRDGAIRGVRLDRGDRLCLDGERLVAVAGSYGMPGSEYRTERESYARVRAIGSADPSDPDAGPREFRVETRDGRIRSYGSTDDSRIEAEGTRRVRLWALARVEDRSGNALRHRYDEDPENGEFQLARIDYTENAAAGLAAYASVRLVWEDRPDTESGYLAGSLASLRRRLAALETWFGEERVREYRLGYEVNPRTGRSRIARVTLCGRGAGACLPATEFAWDAGSPGWREVAVWDLPRQLWADAKDEGELVDVNADGLLDFVHDGNASQARATWLNTGYGFARDDDWVLPADLYSPGSAHSRALFTDLNGDGLPDYVRSFRSGDGSLERATHLNTGAGWRAYPTSALATPGVMWDYHDDHPRQRSTLVDLNGDGLPDSVTAFDERGTPTRSTRLNTGAGFAPADSRWQLPASLWSFGGGEHHTEAALVDLNGDGLPDLLQAFTDEEDRDHKAVWLNTGSGFTESILGWRPPATLWDYSPGPVNPDSKAVRQRGLLADVNGDGLPDFLVCYEGQGGNRELQTYLNTGEGWVRGQDWDTPVVAWSYGGGKYQQTGQLVDVNGDGYPDFVRAYESARDVKRLDAWLNTRRSFPRESGASTAYEPPVPAWSYAPSRPETRATFADIDGDGLADLVRANQTDGVTVRETFINRGALGDRIVEIRDGLGALTRIEYAPLTEPDVYERGERAPYPQATVTDPTRVVRRVGAGPSADALRFVSLRYGSLRFDRLRRLNLGFAWRESTDESSGLVTTESSRQDWPLQGLADVTARARGNGTVIARTRHVYELAAGSPAGVTAIVERETLEEKFELDGALVSTSRTRRDFDRFGNVILEEVQWSDGATRRTLTAFDNDEPRWLIGMVRRLELLGEAPGSGPQTRTRTNDYDASGRLVRTVLEPDRAEQRLERRYGFDAFGNVAAIETSGFGLEPRSELTFFDPRGQRPILELNPLGQSRRSESDPRTGAAVLVFDPNPGLPPTRIDCDALGRPVSTTRPDGVASTTSRSLCDASCPPGAAMLARTDTPGAGASIQYVDALGRELRTETLGFDGSWVRTDRAYDLRGNPVERSRPYYAGHTAQVTRVRFDEIDRAVEAVAPDGARTTWTYAPLLVTVTDPLGHPHGERSDPRGALVERVDPEGGRTAFVRDGFGQLVRMRDTGGNETRSTFDLRGRVVAVDEPNLGTWSYRYDALGARIAQRDAAGTESRFAYDLLGRLVRRDDRGSTTTWTWDSAPNGIGKLARVEAQPAATAREESYDALGRASASTLRIGATSLRVTRTYDGFGRLLRIVYPSGFSVVQRYADSGQLASLAAGAGFPTLWRAESRLADGRVERERLGNGLRTDRLYRPESGRLERILTGDGTTSAVQSLHYDWDLRGNLRLRADQNLSTSESFAYDPLDRLVRVTSGQLGTLDLRYDAAGNLTYKTGHGAYQYPSPGSPRPHGVLATTGGRNCSYDANGNLLGDGLGRELVWSARNELLVVIESGPSTSIASLGYGPEGELLSRWEFDTSANGGTTYAVQFGALYESIVDFHTGRVESRHMIYADGALVAVHTTASEGAAGTRYVHRDHLESTDALTDASGALVERVRYDAHGEVRSQPLGADDPLTLLRVAPRGFSGAVQLRNSQLVHLGGRVYDPKLGRFLSPDPAASAATDSQSQNGYAYARNNPLSLVDPTGYTAEEPPSSPDASDRSFWSVLGGAWNTVSTLATDFSTGVVDTARSFLAPAWGGVKFTATAAWNGIGWAAHGALSLGRKAWDVYNEEELGLGILPDEEVPFGLPQSLYLGYWQWRYQKLELYEVGLQNGQLYITRHEGPLADGSRVNGQQTDLDTAAQYAVAESGGARSIVAYNPSVNLVADTVESALLKFAPSSSARQLAEILTRTTGPVGISGHSQGTLILFWALRLAERDLSNVSVNFFGPATSSLAYKFVLAWSGARPGEYGYLARENDPVATFVGGNFTGGALLPVLLPARILFSAASIPLLPFTSVSPHTRYP